MDNDNVFAPGADFSRPTGGPGGDPVPVDLMAIFERSKDVALANMMPLAAGVIVLFVFSLVSAGISMAFSVWSITDEDMYWVAVGGQYASAIVIGLISMFFSLGMMRMAVDGDRGQTAQVETLWSQGGFYVTAVLASIAVGVIVTFGMMLLIVPGIIAALGLSLTLYVVLDEEVDAITALQRSWELTDGYKTFLLIQALVIGVGMIAVYCFTCGLGLPIAQGFVVVVQGVTYNAIRHAKAA